MRINPISSLGQRRLRTQEVCNLLDCSITVMIVCRPQSKQLASDLGCLKLDLARRPVDTRLYVQLMRPVQGAVQNIEPNGYSQNTGQSGLALPA